MALLDLTLDDFERSLAYSVIGDQYFIHIVSDNIFNLDIRSVNLWMSRIFRCPNGLSCLELFSVCGTVCEQNISKKTT